MDKWLTFDCYGTLIDWEGGLRAAFEGILAKRGVQADSKKLPFRYVDHELDVEAGPYRRYRRVMGEATRRLFKADFGLDLDSGEIAAAAESLPRWKVFADVQPALERLKRSGWKLAILSNTDEDLLEASRKTIGVPVDGWVTAESVGSYKPSLGHWTEFKARYDPGDWVHVGASIKHDVVPATSLGLRTAWIDRNADGVPTAGPKPTWVLPTLERLAP